MVGCKEIQDYIDLVRSDEFPECKYQYALCDFIENVFQDSDVYVDEKQLARYMRQQKWFPFRLFPWEKFVFALHNCTYRKSTGQLRFPILFLYVGRGSGKNGYEAFESFCLTLPINGVEHFNVNIFANSEEQSQTTFNDIKDVLEDHKETFAKKFRWNKEVIMNIATRSEIKYMTSNASTKDGGRPGFLILDEVHAYSDYKLIGVARTGLGKVAHSRQTIITTDGLVRGGPLDDYKKQAKEILFHGADDFGFIPFMCSLDDEKEIDEEKMWYKANPSLQYFPDLLQQYKLDYAQYKINPSSISDFRVKRMNLPCTFEDQSVADYTDIKACEMASYDDFPDFDGADCIAGIDYASTTDFFGAGLLFRYNDEYYWYDHSWVCAESQDLPKIKAPIKKWVDQGKITMVDKREIPPEMPAEWLADMGQKYNIQRLSLDNFRLAVMARALADVGFDTDKKTGKIMLTKRVTQNRYVPLIISLINTHKIHWVGDLMTWYTNNTAVSMDRSGNQNFIKKNAVTRKTDGFMALVSAICAAESSHLQDSHETVEDELSDLAVFSL